MYVYTRLLPILKRTNKPGARRVLTNSCHTSYPLHTHTPRPRQPNGGARRRKRLQQQGRGATGAEAAAATAEGNVTPDVREAIERAVHTQVCGS